MHWRMTTTIQQWCLLHTHPAPNNAWALFLCCFCYIILHYTSFSCFIQSDLQLIKLNRRQEIKSCEESMEVTVPPTFGAAYPHYRLKANLPGEVSLEILLELCHLGRVVGVVESREVKDASGRIFGHTGWSEREENTSYWNQEQYRNLEQLPNPEGLDAILLKNCWTQLPRLVAEINWINRLLNPIPLTGCWIKFWLTLTAAALLLPWGVWQTRGTVLEFSHPMRQQFWYFYITRPIKVTQREWPPPITTSNSRQLHESLLLHPQANRCVRILHKIYIYLWI